MSDNLPDKIRSLGILLGLPASELTKHEVAIVEQYQRGLDNQQNDTDDVDVEFQKIGVFAANGQALFVLPDETTVKHIEGTLLLWKKHQQYYGPKSEEFPDGVLYCRAHGNEHGNPTPEGQKQVPFLRVGPYNCQSCVANEFGSGDNDSKACANIFKTLIKLDGFDRPLRFQVPPSSRREFNTYVNVAKTNNIYLCTVFTKITPHYNSKGGNEWATFTFERGDEIDAKDLLPAMELHRELNTAWLQEKRVMARPHEEGPLSQEPPVHGDDSPVVSDDDLPF